MPDLVGSFEQSFAVLCADTPERIDAVHRLRYQVYCVENRFEDPARSADGRERDPDDDRSVHSLLVHRRSGAAIGTARLILPRPDSGRPLPIERILRAGERAMFRLLPPRRTAEVSRFAVSKEFRRRRGETRYSDVGLAAKHPDLNPAERRLMPHITLGLLRGILASCFDYQITVLAAAMEPALLRILCRLGLDFAPLGPPVEYHGLRQPCVAYVDDLIRSARARGDHLWRYVEGEVAAHAGWAKAGATPPEPRSAVPLALSSARGSR